MTTSGAAAVLWLLDGLSRSDPRASSRPGLGEGDSEGADSPFAPTSSSEPGPSDGFPAMADVRQGFAIEGVFEPVRRAIERNPGQMLVGGFLVLLAECNNSGGGGNSSTGSNNEDLEKIIEGMFGAVRELGKEGWVLAQSTPDLDFGILFAVVGAVLGVVVCCMLLQLALYAWIVPGWVRMHQEAHQSGVASFNTLFGSTDRFLDMLAWRIVNALVGLVPTVVLLGPVAAVLAEAPTSFEQFGTAFLSPGFLGLLVLSVLTLAVMAWWVALGTAMGNYFVVLEGAGPIVALRRSFDAARGHRLQIFLFGIVWSFLVTAVGWLLGFFTLCIGLIITLPIARAAVESAWLRAFLRARSGPDALADWAGERPTP